jgi:hypothetical protein
MFDVPPEALDEDVVEHSPAPIHADDDAFAGQHVGKGFAGELRALIAVEDFRLAMGAQGILQAIHTEHRVHAVADPPAEHLTAIPVDHRHQVGKATQQADVRDVRAPHLIRPDHSNPAQQVRIYLVRRVSPARVRTRRHAGQPHQPHQPLNPLAIDQVTCFTEEDHHPPAAVERVPGVFLIDQATV